MSINNASDEVVLKELGSRIARCRLNKNMTQAALAVEAGVSKPTIHRMENGASTQLTNLLRVLRALKLSENFDLVIPEPGMSPVQQLKMRGSARSRASSAKVNKKKESAGGWTWGDES